MKIKYFLVVLFCIFYSLQCIAQHEMIHSSDRETANNQKIQANIIANQVKTYPNPFSEYITISFSLKNNSTVQLLVFDSNGQMVAQIRNSEATKGNYKMQWNGTNFLGAQVKNGTYKIQLIAGKQISMANVLLLR